MYNFSETKFFITKAVFALLGGVLTATPGAAQTSYQTAKTSSQQATTADIGLMEERLVTGWQQNGHHLWRASCPVRPTGIFRNNQPLPLGRYPNANAPDQAALSIRSHSGYRQLESSRPLPGYWTGAEAVFTPARGAVSRRARVTDQQGNTLTLNTLPANPLTDGGRFFLQDHLATLDQTGEWFYDPTSQTLWLYDDQSNPSQYTVTVSASSRVR